MKPQVISDQVVSFDDALRWCETLYKIKPRQIIAATFDLEPAALGVAMNLMERACDQLEREGVSQQHREYIFNQGVRVAAVAIELMRRGHAELWRDFVDPDDETKETRH